MSENNEQLGCAGDANSLPERTERLLCIGHSADIDRMYGRFREQDGDISGVKSRVTAVESRLRGLETSMHDLRRLHADTDARINRLAHDVDGIKSGQIQLTDMVRAQTAILNRHTLEEAERQERHTSAIQRMSRIVIGVFVALAVLSITLQGLLAIVAEQDINTSLFLQLFGG